MNKFKTYSNDWYLEHFLWNCLQVNTTGLQKSTLIQVMVWEKMAFHWPSTFAFRLWKKLTLPQLFYTVNPGDLAGSLLEAWNDFHNWVPFFSLKHDLKNLFKFRDWILRLKTKKQSIFVNWPALKFLSFTLPNRIPVNWPWQKCYWTMAIGPVLMSSMC